MFRIDERDIRRVLSTVVSGLLLTLAPAQAQENATALVMPRVVQSSESAGPAAAPGWVASVAETVSPEQASLILGTGSEAPDAAANPASARAAYAEPGDYAELAEALENDPLRIYQYVRNHFEYVPYFGFLKGPYLTLHERSGNDYDQASLLIELLRAAGIQARYEFGTLAAENAIDVQAVSEWLGTDNNIDIISSTFAQGGVPTSRTASTIRFNHVWVEAKINQRKVRLAPAIKPSVRSNAINLAAAMNYSQADVLAVAGGSRTGNSIKGIDLNALGDYLTDRATDLQEYLRLNHPNDRVEDVLGGFTIVPDNSASLPASLPIPFTGTPYTRDDVPPNFIHKLRLRHGGIDITRNIPDIAGRKLSLRYTGDTVEVGPAPTGATDYGALGIGVTGATKVWQGTNTTGVPIQVVASVSGQNASAFSFVSGGGSNNVAVDGAYAVRVKFSGAGQNAGRKNAKLTLKYYHAGNRFAEEDVLLTGVVEPHRLAQLYLDEHLEASESKATGELNKLQLIINHPYAAYSGSFGDETRDFNVKRTGTYVIVSAFGGDRHSTLLSERQRLLSRMTIDGTPDDAPERLTETLNVIGQTWMQQTQLNSDLAFTLSGRRNVQHHRFGIAGQEESYFVDMAAQWSTLSDRVAAPVQGAFKAQSFIASAMEHSVLDQLQGVSDSQGLTNPAASTIRLLALSNWMGRRLFVANNGNYGGISTHLRNYDSDQMEKFQQLVNTSHTLLIPEDGAIPLKGWTGLGYVYSLDRNNDLAMGMIIEGGLNGGKGTAPGVASTRYVQNDYVPETTLRKEIPVTPAGDPVDLGTGAFISSVTDFEVAGGGTRGFAFTRSYNSQMASQDTAGLGRGWTHNYNIYLSEHTDVEAALGERTVFHAIPMIVVNEVTRKLLRNQYPSPVQWGVAAMVANWGMDQLLNKSATVHMGSQALTFQEMPNGEFIPPAGVTTKLTRVGQSFRLEERLGSTWSFDTDNRLTSITDVDGQSMNFTYNAAGKVSQVKDAHARTLYLQYTNETLVQAYDSTFHAVSFEQTNGNLTGVNGLEGANWAYGYDSLHRLETVTNPVNVQIVDNTYNDFDRVVVQRAPRDTGLETYRMHYGGFFSSEEDPEGMRSTYHFDLDGRRIAIQDALGNTARVVYDGQGHVVQQIDPLGLVSASVYDADNNLKEQVDPDGNKTEFRYDSKHRLVRTIDPLNHWVTFRYNGRNHVTDRIDHYGNSVKTAYLANGLVDTVTDPRGTQTYRAYDGNGYLSSIRTGSHPAINWNYNARGDLQSLVDEEGAMTSFVTNNRGLVSKRTDPLGRSSTYKYTKAGKLAEATDRNGSVTYYTYTDSGKPNLVLSTDSLVDFNYDSRDNLVEMIDSTGTTTSTHDAVGRLTAHTDSNGHTVGYEYDAAGNLVTLIYPPGNRKVKYTYDNLNRLSTVSIDWLAGKPTMRYVYDDASRLDRVEHFNAMETNYTWDKSNRLTGIAHGGAATLVQYSFQLDANGNRVQEIISPEPVLPGNLSPDDTSFAYNFLRNRLNSASTHSYTYSTGGELTGTIDTFKNRYIYDQEGQLARKDSVVYTFDDAHRLTQRGNDSFFYDGVGNRLKAIRNGVQTQYVYDASGNLLAETNGSGQVTRYYIYGTGLAAMVKSSNYYVYHFDGTGHTVALTDASNTAVNKYAYSPYGKILNQLQQFDQPFKYAGQVGIFTESDNLYYMRARYYDADAGRFISEDPAGFVDGPNLYAYVGGNPIMLVDPTGLYAGYGNGLYSSYYTTKNAAEAASQADYAEAAASLGDVLTIATPMSGPLAPYVGGAATGFTILSIGLDPSTNWKSGVASLAVETVATFVLRKAQAPLQLSDATVAAAAGLVQTPLVLANVANSVSNKASGNSCP